MLFIVHPKWSCNSAMEYVFDMFHTKLQISNEDGANPTMLGVAPVKSPKIIFAQTPFNFSGHPKYIYVDKIDPNFYTNGSAPLGA